MKKVLFGILFCSIAAAQPLVSFNAGELSPLLKYRIDFEKRYLGCATMENLIVKPQGAAVRRPGTYYIAQTKNNARARVTSFTYSTSDAYVLEWGNLYVRFYRNGGQLLSGSSAYEVTTTYTTAQLRDLHLVQSNDVLYIFHPDVAPRKLTRTDHTDWAIADVDWSRGPFEDQNTTVTTITPSAATGTITLTASASIFTSDHVGALWEITHTIDGDEVSGSFAGTGTSATIDVRENQEYTFTTHGVWSGTVKLQRSYDSGSTWSDVLVFSSEWDRNASFSETEEVEDAIYRVNATANNGIGGNQSILYNLVVYSFDVDGVVDITAYTSGTVVTGTVDYELGGTSATDRWAEGAWSDDNGWPRTACFYQDRLFVGGNAELPTTVWASQTSDYENMLADVTDSGAIVYEVAGAQQNPIVWLAERKGVVAGTSGGVFQVSSASGDNEAVTYANIQSQRVSSSGCTNIQPVLLGASTLFVDRDKQIVRGLGYDLQTDGFIAPDLTVLANHISDPCFVEVAVQRSPDPIVWYIRQDGEVCGLTFDEAQDVHAWHRHTIGTAESVAVIPGTDEDEVWFCVQRSINGNTKYFIEQMQPQDWGSDPNDIFFVDCALTYDGSATTTLTGLSHLIGEDVQVCGNGGYYQEETVSGSGTVTLDEAMSVAHAGLGYTSSLVTFPIETQQSLGAKKRIPYVTLAFYDTLLCEYGLSDGTMYEVLFDDSTLIYGGADDLFTGYRRVQMDTKDEEELAIKVRQTKPFPMTVTAIVPRLEVATR
jgi:hypothetical protein